MTPTAITHAICEVFSIAPHQLHGRRRRAILVTARQHAWYLQRHYAGMSYADIARSWRYDSGTVQRGCEGLHVRLNRPEWRVRYERVLAMALEGVGV